MSVQRPVLDIVFACAAIAAATAAAAGVTRRRRALALRALERYARAHRLRFTPLGGSARSPRVEGVAGDVPFVIDLVRIDGCLRTRVSAPARRGRAPRLRIVQRCRLARALAADRDEAGALDAAYRVTSVELGLACDALGAVRASMEVLAARSGVWLASDGARVVCSWEGIEADGRLLDAARDAVASVARMPAPDGPYR